ncbi:MAG: ribokinase [Thermoguttaceae bacterium]|nr:ribokinase [Thermoguttaceae bacterium]
MDRSGYIVVVGSSNTDMVVCSDRIPKPGETVTGGSFLVAQGGKGANQAVAAARLDIPVKFVAKVGNDVFGDQAVEHYRKENINTDWIFRDPNAATGVALILVDKQGENLISVASGANHHLTPADIDRAATHIASASLLIMQLEIPLETVMAAAKIAADAGVPVLLDPAPAPDASLPAELLKNVTFIKPNEHEAQRLTGITVTDTASAKQAAEVLRHQGVRNVVITLGSAGAFFSGELGEGFVPAYSVEAKDTTAAGDSFSGAFGAALAHGAAIADALRFAARAASVSVTRLGAQPSLPKLAEMAQFADIASLLCD